MARPGSHHRASARPDSRAHCDKCCCMIIGGGDIFVCPAAAPCATGRRSAKWRRARSLSLARPAARLSDSHAQAGRKSPATLMMPGFDLRRAAARVFALACQCESLSRTSASRMAGGGRATFGRSQVASSSSAERPCWPPQLLLLPPHNETSWPACPPFAESLAGCALGIQPVRDLPIQLGATSLSRLKSSPLSHRSSSVAPPAGQPTGQSASDLPLARLFCVPAGGQPSAK